MPEVKKMIAQTLDMSLNKADVRLVSLELPQPAILLTCSYRECLAKNVDIWMRLNKIFNSAVPWLSRRSLPADCPPGGTDTPESATLILKHYDDLVRDLNFLNSLLVISRNMLAIKETAQELCATVNFDKAVRDLMILCVNVTSKGYDGETVDEPSRGKLNDVTELCGFNVH
jgi:palmitoyltransferase